MPVLEPVETVPCKWCGDPATFLIVKECGRCWELSCRIQATPGLATKMLEALGFKVIKNNTKEALFNWFKSAFPDWDKEDK